MAITWSRAAYLDAGSDGDPTSPSEHVSPGGIPVGGVWDGAFVMSTLVSTLCRRMASPRRLGPSAFIAFRNFLSALSEKDFGVPRRSL